ncbi:hypothetical protein NOR_01103 [Metarhizium rileyi]|uniref:Uncharacterized protein n=1 Tax=Metarhizium rileyi (strain RCEF 4871) TaxID=1649241 RepID=A0A167JRN2_METRR|nr:hypothetical protein NOR_01103 [Metarhizium rileyi RCEF 4871]
MNKEEYFRQKSKAAELQVKLLTRDLEARKDELQQTKKDVQSQQLQTETAKNSLQEANHTVERVTQQLSSLRQQAQQQTACKDKLRRELQESQFQSKRYRTALAAAFKLVDDLGAKTTLGQLLECTDQQLSRTGALVKFKPSEEGCAGNRVFQVGRGGSVAPRTSTGPEGPYASDHSDDEAPLQAGRERIRDFYTPSRAIKRETGRASQDSDTEPRAKKRKLGDGSPPRNILLDE